MKNSSYGNSGLLMDFIRLYWKIMITVNIKSGRQILFKYIMFIVVRKAFVMMYGKFLIWPQWLEDGFFPTKLDEMLGTLYRIQF